MNLLIKILQAAHCRSTHQYFVTDALPLVTSPRAARFASVLLKNHHAYLIGAKDPDKTFRDFRNHVLHVGDNHWGGAPAAAENWYGKLQREMAASNWREAAYAAGVLSHYFTDPLMPLHTAQSDMESIIHRPLEWSVTKSYGRIRRRWKSSRNRHPFQLPQGENWLSDAITHGATVAHSHYNELINRYDLQAGTKHPPSGLDNRSIDILALMFGMAITGWAQVLQRAANESRVAIPKTSLSMTTVLATLKMPSAWITRRIESADQHDAVQAIFDEYQATGKVVENLPLEVASVRRERQFDQVDDAPAASNTPASATAASATAAPPIAAPPIAHDPIAINQRPSDVLPIDRRRLNQRPTNQRPTNQRPTNQRRPNRRQPSLSPADDLVDAPSIGPKTAKRFAKIGVTKVAQFLAASPDQMAALIDTRWITVETVRDWQSQAWLVCQIPSLCGYKSQLLVSVGCTTTATLAKQQADALHQLISDFANTSEGQRILRSSNVPSKENVARWISDANQWIAQRKSA